MHRSFCWFCRAAAHFSFQLTSRPPLQRYSVCCMLGLDEKFELNEQRRLLAAVRSIIEVQLPLQDSSVEQFRIFLHKNIRVRIKTNDYPQNMFLLRTGETYPLIVVKYPSYLFHCTSRSV